MDEADSYKEALNTGICMYRRCRYPLGYNGVKTHMKIYHLDYDCPSCDRSFFLEQALADHIDATEHYFVCRVCSEEFVTKDDLSRHIKTMGHNRRQQQRPHVSSSPRTIREEPVLTSFTCSERSTVSWLSIPIENAPVTFQGRFPNVFKEMERYKSVTEFIKKVIRPNDEYNRRCEDLINRLKKFLENNTGLHVKRVFIGGSVGKKTNVMNHSDVDLIVFINDYPTMVEFQRNLDSVLKTLERHVLHDFNWAKEVEHIGTTPYAVQFKAKLKGSTDDVMMHVDLLPALDILDQVRSFKPQHCGRSNHQSSAEELRLIFREMENQEDKARQYYSVSFAEEQTNFVKASPHDVRDVIRLLKYWKKTENVPVRSYFLELLVIHMWQKKWQRTSKRSGYTMVVEVVNELTNIKEMKITWPDRYISTEYSPLPKKPVLLDPLNPYNNVAPSVDDLNDIVEQSRYLLLKIRKYSPTDHAMPKKDNANMTVIDIPELRKHIWVDNDKTTWGEADNSCGCIII